MERFQVVSINSSDPFSSIESLLTQLSHSQGLSAPLNKTISHLVSLGAKTAIVQHKVSDPDFEAEYDLYYVRWTLKVDRRCIRIHFFSEPSESDDPLSSIDAFYASDNEERKYLGFVTLRPIPRSIQGATILKPLLHPRNNTFVIPKDKFEVNIAGRKFFVVGTPFLQQDNAVGACAQASIWMALRTLRRKIGQNAYSPAAITEAATRFVASSRTLPNRTGLSISQIVEAIRQSGYSPHSILLKNGIAEIPSDRDLAIMRLKLYPYIESGIPVLLGLYPNGPDGHAVLVIGHDWTEHPTEHISFDSRNPQTSTNLVTPNAPGQMDLVDASSWINHLYIHNDNSGPYLPLPGRATKDYALSQAVFAIPFLHKDILMDAEEAQLACHQILLNCLTSEVKRALPKLVFRVYLQTRSEFRESIIDSELHEQAKRYYRLKWLPKRLWVAEINQYDNYENAPSGGARRLGEILLDPSSDPADGHFLAVRLSKELLNLTSPTPLHTIGVIIDRDPFDGAIKGLPILSGICKPISRGT